MEGRSGRAPHCWVSIQRAAVALLGFCPGSATDLWPRGWEEEEAELLKALAWGTGFGVSQGSSLKHYPGRLRCVSAGCGARPEPRGGCFLPGPGEGHCMSLTRALSSCHWCSSRQGEEPCSSTCCSRSSCSGRFFPDSRI